MKTAEEARMAMKSFDPKKLPGYQTVSNAIDLEIRLDKTALYLSDSLDPRLKRYLESIGYKVTSTFDRNETVTIISWKE